eukprot:340589_1
MEMSHILLQRLHINPNNPNESHPLECLFYYCLTSFFFTLTKNHLNFKYCNRNDDVVIECLLPHVSSQTDIALLIVSYTQFKWSLFITLIYECFDEINAIYHSRYKYNLFYMIQKLTRVSYRSLLNDHHIESIIFEMETNLLNTLRRSDLSELVIFSSLVSLYPSWTHPKHWLQLLLYDDTFPIEDLFVQCCTFQQTDKWKRLYLFGYLPLDRIQGNEYCIIQSLDEFYHSMFDVFDKIIVRRLVPLMERTEDRFQLLLYVFVSCFRFEACLCRRKRRRHAEVFRKFLRCCFVWKRFLRQVVDHWAMLMCDEHVIKYKERHMLKWYAKIVLKEKDIM